MGEVNEPQIVEIPDEPTPRKYLVLYAVLGVTLLGVFVLAARSMRSTPDPLIPSSNPLAAPPSNPIYPRQ